MENSSFEVVRAGESAAEKPGRRATGVAFEGGADLGRPAAEPEEREVRVLKRQAVGICMQWLSSPESVKAHEDGGYCYLKVEVNGVWGEAKATSWWDCLRAVQAHLQRRGLLAVEETPEFRHPRNFLRRWHDTFTR